jgi:hypothetical protein
MENENQNLIAALKYCDMGFSVIPVGRNKKPLVAWEKYQATRATREQIEHWFSDKDINIGVVTGAISGIVVIDIDTKEKVDRQLPRTVTSQTGRGGWHLFCKHPGRHVKTVAGILPHVDIRGDGGYVVMPPSLHENGNRYEWVILPEDSDFAELPGWVLEEEPKNKKTNGDWETVIKNKIPDGVRNQTAAQITGKLLHHLPQELWDAGWLTMQALNKNNGNPSLEENELRTVFESIAGREAKKRANNGTAHKNHEIKAITLSELLGTEFPNPQWLVERLIPHEAVTLISGAPASYKTFLTFDIALKIASGEKVFGEFQSTQSPVLIIDEENHPRVLQERAKLLSENPGLQIFIASKNCFLLGEGSVKKVVEYAKSKNVQLVIFDSFICIHDSDENVASEMRDVMKHLKEIANNGIAVIVIHHHRKKGKEKSNASQEIRGSSDILAQVDCHLAIDRKGRDASVTIQQSKLREAQEMPPFVVRFHCDGNKGRFEYGGAAKERQSKKDNLKLAVKKVLEGLDRTPNRKELWEMVQQTGIEGGEATFKTAIKEMIAAREMFATKGSKNSTLYSLKEFAADNG